MDMATTPLTVLSNLHLVDAVGVFEDHPVQAPDRSSIAYLNSM